MTVSRPVATLSSIRRRVSMSVGGLPLEETERYCSKLDKQGFKGYWLPENNGPDAFTRIAVLSRVTSKLRLGTSVAGIYGRSPLIAAMSAASLAKISEGRFVLGLGTQTESHVREWYGEEFGDPIVRAREYATVVKRLLDGESVTFRGKQIRVKNAKLLEPPKGKVKVVMAAIGPRMIRTAAEVADGIFGTSWSEDYLAEVVIPSAKIGLERSGRRLKDLELICSYGALVTGQGVSSGTIRSRVVMSATVPFFKKIFEVSGFGEEHAKINAAWRVGDIGRALNLVSEEMVAKMTVAGVKTALKGRVEGLLASGLTEVVLQALAGRVFYPLHPGHLPSNIHKFNKIAPYPPSRLQL